MTQAKILVAEDEECLLALLCTLLRNLPYEIIPCRDGEEALHIARREGGRIRLLLTDMNLCPSMDGIELAQSMRPLCPGLDVLYVSGVVDDSPVYEEVRRGAAAFLPKPFTAKSLLEAVAALLGGASCPLPRQLAPSASN